MNKKILGSAIVMAFAAAGVVLRCADRESHGGVLAGQPGVIGASAEMLYRRPCDGLGQPVDPGFQRRPDPDRHAAAASLRLVGVRQHVRNDCRGDEATPRCVVRSVLMAMNVDTGRQLTSANKLRCLLL